MAHIVEDRVLETSTTTGTGNFSLAGAVAGYRDFDSVMANGDTCYYMIEAVDTSGIPTGEWETGRGTFNDTDTLVRTSVSRSSNANAAVSFSAGTKRVSISLIAASARYRGGLVYKGSDQTTANYSANPVMTFNTVGHDTESIYDGTNKFIIPAALNGLVMQFGFQMALDFVTSNTAILTSLTQNGSYFTGNTAPRLDSTVTSPIYNGWSAPITVSTSQEYEVHLSCSDTSITVYSGISWFAYKVLS